MICKISGLPFQLYISISRSHFTRCTSPCTIILVGTQGIPPRRIGKWFLGRTLLKHIYYTTCHQKVPVFGFEYERQPVSAGNIFSTEPQQMIAPLPIDHLFGLGQLDVIYIVIELSPSIERVGRITFHRVGHLCRNLCNSQHEKHRKNHTLFHNTTIYRG